LPRTTSDFLAREGGGKFSCEIRPGMKEGKGLRGLSWAFLKLQWGGGRGLKDCGGKKKQPPPGNNKSAGGNQEEKKGEDEGGRIFEKTFWGEEKGLKTNAENSPHGTVGKGGIPLFGGDTSTAKLA